MMRSTRPETAPAGDEGREARRPLFAGASLSAVSQVSTALTGALVGVLLARLLGPEGVGAYNVLLSLFIVLLALGTLGLDFGGSYLVARREWPQADAVRQLQVGAGVLGVACAAIAVLFFVATRETAFRAIAADHLLVIAAALPFALSMQLTSSLALALQRYEMSASGPAVQSILSLAFIAALAPTLGLQGAVIGFAGSYLITAVGLTAFGFRRFGSPRPSWLRRSWSELRRSSAFGFGVSFNNALGMLIQRVDLFILNAFVSSAVVGKYALAFGLTTLQLLLPRSLGQVVLPRVASLGRFSSADQQYVARKSLRHAVLLGVAAGFLMAAALPLAPLIYGDRFGLTVGFGEVLVPGVAAAGLTSVMAPILVGHGKSGTVTRLGVFGVLVASALYAGLIPPFGAWGAAIASTASYSLVAMAYAAAVSRLGIVASGSEWLPGAEELNDYRLMIRAAGQRLRR